MKIILKGSLLLLIALLISIVSEMTYSSNPNIEFLDGAFVQYLSVLTSGDIEGTGEKKLIKYADFWGTLQSMSQSSPKEYIPSQPGSYTRGEISLVSALDLNKDGVDEIVVGHIGVFTEDSPSIFIFERRDGAFEVVWESEFLGMVKGFFKCDDIIFVNIYDYDLESDILYVLEYTGDNYEISKSYVIGLNRKVVFVGKLGEIPAISIITVSTNSKHVFYVRRFGQGERLKASLIEYDVIEYQEGTFTKVGKKYSFPKKDIWDFKTADLDNDGIEEVIIGVFENGNAKLEILKWGNNDYSQLTQLEVGEYSRDDHGFVLADVDGDGNPEIVTYQGIMISYKNEEFVMRNIFSELGLRFDIGISLGPMNMIAMDFNNNGKDEIIFYAAKDINTIISERVCETYIIYFGE